ncbi:hypothetical protein ACC758_39350, partial [Rhizobium ruizarguesonis]
VSGEAAPGGPRHELAPLGSLPADAAGVLTFITLPLAVVIAASFSPTSAVKFRPWEWTARWYGDLVSERWRRPFLLSVNIA